MPPGATEAPLLGPDGELDPSLCSSQSPHDAYVVEAAADNSIQHTKAAKTADPQRQTTKENSRLKQNGG
jgi:hypothetical protein